jgi:diaminopimelate decarboxylase
MVRNHTIAEIVVSDRIREIIVMKNYPNSPYFLLDEKVLQNRARKVRSAFPGWRIEYSAKTNYEVSVLKVIRKEGLEIEVNSGLEIFAGMKAGYRGEQMTMDGPAKRLEDLEYAIKSGVRRFYIDWPGELEKLDKLCQKSKTVIQVGYRLNWKGGRLGMTVEQIEKAFSQRRFVNSIGVAVHVGTQKGSVGEYLQAADVITPLVTKLKLKEVNLGGGFPSSGERRWWQLGKIPDIDEFGQALSGLFPKHIQMAVQPGRYVVGSSMKLITRVLAVKGKWLYVDATTNYLGGSTGWMFGKRLVEAVDASGSQVRTYHIAGCTPSGADIVAMYCKLPIMRENQLLEITNVGAYTISRASRFAALIPPIYMIGNSGSVKLVRNGDIYADGSNKSR